MDWVWGRRFCTVDAEWGSSALISGSSAIGVVVLNGKAVLVLPSCLAMRSSMNVCMIGASGGIMLGNGMVDVAGAIIAVAPDRGCSLSGSPSPASLGT